MKTFFALVVLAVVAMATAHHEEGHVGTQPVMQPDTHTVEHTHEPAKPTKDLKSAEAVYIAAPYAYPYAYSGAYPYAYSGAYPYAYGAYPYYG